MGTPQEVKTNVARLLFVGCRHFRSRVGGGGLRFRSDALGCDFRAVEREALRARRPTLRARARPPRPRVVSRVRRSDLLRLPRIPLPLVDWYLHELNLPFESRPPHDSNNPHPFGQIPALLDATDDPGNPVELGGGGWSPAPSSSTSRIDTAGSTTPPRAPTLGKWVVWANASLDPCLFIENERGQVLDTGARAANGSPRALTRLEATLAERKFLAGDDARAADAAVAAYLLYVPMFFADVSFARWPNIAEYMEGVARDRRTRERSAWKRRGAAERAKGWATTERRMMRAREEDVEKKASYEGIS